MTKRLELSGLTFGRLTVIKSVPNNYKVQKSTWECICVCGTITIVVGSNLINGTTKSCGCYQRSQTSISKLKHGHSNSTTEWHSWVNMKTRCYNIKSADYKYYGGRGIIVCERWKFNFDNFLLDMGLKPSPTHSLDRINTNGNYEPNNCRWGTQEQQARNKRTNKWFEYNGVKMILADWAKYFGVDQGNLHISIKSKGFDNVYKFYYEKHNGNLPVYS